jgi:DmsE family decaheme c-type cytochrome
LAPTFTRTTSYRISLLAFLAAASASAQTTPNAYIGSEWCKGCHADLWQTFNQNPHFKSIASGKEKPEDTGCEGCHGPGDQHLQACGGKATIIAFSDLSRARILDACLRCHAQTISRANVRQSSHSLNDVVCTDCHLIHGTPVRKFLLAKAQTELCYECHANVRADFSMPFKHRVNEGFMTCTDCHNPHGSFAPEWRLASRPRMTGTGAADEEPCLKCHSEKRGPFTYEHPPVRIEGCEICHAPHGSTNSRLLRRPVVFTMCLECHNGAPGFGLRGAGDPHPSQSHNMNDPRYQNCTNCHVRIHGSNSDAFFLR